MMKPPYEDALSEGAKTVGKGVDAARDFGSFLAPIVKRPLEDAVGICSDKLAYIRWEKQERLKQRAKDFMQEQGIKEPTRAVPLNFAIPLIQAATMEEDNYLQDTWAKLLVNAMDAESGVEMRRAYITILENLTAFDVKILNTLYNAVTEENIYSYLAAYLPEKLVVSTKENDEIPDTPPQNSISLYNLQRLGCVINTETFKGQTNEFKFVMISVLGKSFVEACTLRNK